MPSWTGWTGRPAGSAPVRNCPGSTAPGPVHQLSDGLAEAIRVALTAARWTRGVTDPTVGAALIALGYDRDFAAIGAGTPPPPAGPGPVPGWRSVTLDGAALRLPAGIVLDLGATAKGLGSDRAAAAAGRACRQGGVFVSLGGDIAVAGLPPRGGWPVAVADSCDPGGGAARGHRRRAGGRPRRRASGPDCPAGGGRPGHLVGDLPAMPAGRAAGPPHHRSAHPVPGARPVADGERRRGQLR